jgi:hypothetical protein
MPAPAALLLWITHGRMRAKIQDPETRCGGQLRRLRPLPVLTYLPYTALRFSADAPSDSPQRVSTRQFGWTVWIAVDQNFGGGFGVRVPKETNIGKKQK